MAVVDSDIKQCLSTTMATSAATTNIGGAVNLSAVVTGAAVGEIFYSGGADVVGGAARTQAAKTFIVNTSTTNDLSSAVVWWPTLIDSPTGTPTAATVSFVSTSTSDDSSYTVRFIGRDSSGNPLQEDVIANGTTTVTTTNQFLPPIDSWESRDTTSGALKALSGSGTFTHGTTVVSQTPPNYYSGTSEAQTGLVATLGDSGTSTVATAVPGGITLSKARTQGTALGLANSGTLTKSGGANAYWWLLTFQPGRKPSPDIQVPTFWSGLTGA